MTYCFNHYHYRDRKFKEMLDVFAMLKKGHCDGHKVRIGRLQNLLSSSCVGNDRNPLMIEEKVLQNRFIFNYDLLLAEHLDFMNLVDPSDLDISPFTQTVHEYSGYQSLTDVPKAIIFNEPFQDFSVSTVLSLRSKLPSQLKSILDSVHLAFCFQVYVGDSRSLPMY